MKYPIFIVGHPRSGSTMLATILGRNPDLLALPETHFFGTSYGGFFLSRIWSRRNAAALVKQTLDKNLRILDVGYDEAEIHNELEGQKPLREKHVLDAIFKLTLNASESTQIVEKTPNHIEHFQKLLDWYPDAKVICIVRDARDAVNSLLNVPWTHSNSQRHALHWNWCVSQGVSFEKKYPGRVKLIRYEDVVLSPESTLEDLSQFLGIDYTAAMLNSEESQATIPEWEADWKKQAGGKIQKSNAFKWKQTQNPDYKTWEALAYSGLKHMNYELRNDAIPMKSQLYKNIIFAIRYRLKIIIRTHLTYRKNKFRHKGEPR